jgi:hypothetical protein
MATGNVRTLSVKERLKIGAQNVAVLCVTNISQTITEYVVSVNNAEEA